MIFVGRRRDPDCGGIGIASGVIGVEEAVTVKYLIGVAIVEGMRDFFGRFLLFPQLPSLHAAPFAILRRETRRVTSCQCRDCNNRTESLLGGIRASWSRQLSFRS
ncbi:hypothetical protein AKJ16_DCAP21238 [Drosera capensis]